MGKSKKKKKQPAPDNKRKETGTEQMETEEKKQMTQEEEVREAAEETAADGLQEEQTQTAEDAGAAGEAQSAEAETENEEAAPEEEQSAPEDGETDPGEEAQDFFKKKKEKKDKKDEQIAELTDKLQRQMAEFENFRRRTEKEKATMYDMGTRDTVEKLLPVVDNFERGLAGAAESDPFAEGMKMIYKQMMTMLTDLGVTPIDAAGNEFDPNLHNAVMHVDDENFGENIVAEELQKGYMFKDHVVRHSMVKVAN